jgi:hypothetical protein
MKRNADQHRRPAQFKVGDSVLLATEHLKISDAQFNKKLAHLFCGPFPIKAVINANAYQLELPNHMQIHSTVNISHLRPYHDGRQQFPDRPVSIGLSRPPPDAEDSNAYEVERVLAQRGSGRNAKYLVLWKGYAYTEASWEPASSLMEAPLAMEEFRELQKTLRRPERVNQASGLGFADRARRESDDRTSELKVKSKTVEELLVAAAIEQELSNEVDSESDLESDEDSIDINQAIANERIAHKRTSELFKLPEINSAYKR